jgi:hypothetical protein
MKAFTLKTTECNMQHTLDLSSFNENVNMARSTCAYQMDVLLSGCVLVAFWSLSGCLLFAVALVLLLMLVAVVYVVEYVLEHVLEDVVGYLASCWLLSGCFMVVFWLVSGWFLVAV